MQIWLHTRTPETGDALGFVEVRPNSAALELIAGGFADPINKGSLTKLAPEAKWDGTSALVLAFDGPPSVEVDPVISGDTAVGSVLECTPGSYFGHPIPTIARQWLRNGADIVGATGLEYTLVTADAGKGVSVRETVTNEFGFVEAVSNVIDADAPLTPGTGQLTAAAGTAYGLPLAGFGDASLVPSGAIDAVFGEGSGTFGGQPVAGFFVFTGFDFGNIYSAAAPSPSNVRIFDSAYAVVFEGPGAWNEGTPGSVSITSTGFKFVAGQTYYFEAY